ncbi:hypothetical protein D9758_004660 [Tetrapyrgos nigripes]|uniref:Flavin-containing monooxygenase n=1 Tax=Tetrapyrgos nigripes TaxID=182062 RepID=A0A8H5GZY7_9AGAR|nr:hypothetical protein D9758_004660 [Tetrapyrgos nigripes]
MPPADNTPGLVNDAQVNVELTISASQVVVIGAGFSGITAGIRLLQRVRNLDLTIYEANAGVGGTLWTNRYPGLACDIPAHSYQLTFAENPNWSAFYPPGPEIREYLGSVVDKYKLMPYIKLQHKLIRSEYDEQTGKWQLTIQRAILEPTGQSNTEDFFDTADVLITAIGILSRWQWPDIQGLETFQGKVVHSAQWETGEGDNSPTAKWEDTVKGWKDRKVAVVGVGSSAIQIVPSLQPKVAHLSNFVRGKTWISSVFGQSLIAEISKNEGASNYEYTDEDKKRFLDAKVYNEYRKKIERDVNAALHQATLLGNPMQEGARKLFRAEMIRRLAKRPWIADHLLPDFAVACRRLTPGPGYLEALCEDNVEFVPDAIKQVTLSGIETVDGRHRDFDIIICATGFDISWKLPFPFIGRGGITINEKHHPHPRTYLSVAVDGFPNWFCLLGPNSVGAGSLLIVMERQVDYAVQVVLKLQRERMKSIEVKKEAIDDFDEYLESYFPKTVFGSKCKSWYKMGKEEGRVVAVWPGSPLHAVYALAHPRWEDYNYEPLDPGVKNRFYWLGDGSTMADTIPGVDSSWYLDPKAVDVPPGYGPCPSLIISHRLALNIV